MHNTALTQDTGVPPPGQVVDFFELRIREVISLLADLDARYERNRAALDEWQGPAAAKIRLQGLLEARHREDRQPYVLELADIHQSRMSVRLFRPVR